MYNFSSGEVPQSVIDGVMQLATIPQQSVSHITENILKYLTGVGGVNKEAMAEGVTNFASMANIEIGQAQILVKVLLNILKASYRGGLTSAQVEADFQKLTGSVEATKPIAMLWSKYVHQSGAATDAVTANTDTRQPETVPSSTGINQPAAVVASTESRPPEDPACSDGAPAEVPLSLDDVLNEGGVRAFDELVDIQWSFGVTAASSDPAHVGRTFVRLSLHVQSAGGVASVKKVQLTVSQFYSLLHQLEKARAIARFM